ncbi:DUF2884 family protein [Vibrio sp. RC27]
MKVILSLLLVIVSYSVSAEQCDVSVERDIKSNDGWLLFHLEDGTNVEINDESQVLIGGDVVELTPEQLQAVQQYRQSVTHHMESLADYAASNAQFLDHVIDDIAASLGAPGAFDELKEELDQFWGAASEAYLNTDTVILPAGTFDSLSETWKSHALKAKALFDEEFIEQVWQVLLSKIQEEGGISLSAMGGLLLELEANISERLETHSKELDVQENKMCESLHEIVDQEDDMRNQIPELQDYRIFTI